MPNQDPDQEHPVKEQADQTLSQKVEALQEASEENGGRSGRIKGQGVHGRSLGGGQR